MGLEIGGFFGLLWLILVIYAIVKTIDSGAGTGVKVLWIVVILLLPFFGVILWLLFGPQASPGGLRTKATPDMHAGRPFRTDPRQSAS